MSRVGRPPLGLAAAAVLAIALAVLPLAYLVLRALDGGAAGAASLILRWRTVELLAVSIGLAVAVTASCLVIGTGLAWLVTRTDLPGRRFWQVACGLPLALPSYVAAWSWIAVNPALAGFAGSWLVLTSISYPYVYLPAMAALRRTDPDAEAVARTLGLGQAATWARIVMPQLRPALAGGALLVGLYALSDFGAVATMRLEVLTTSIFRSYRSLFDITPAAVLGCLLAGLALLVVVIEQLTRRGRARLAARVPRRQPVVPLGPWRWVAPLAPAGVLAVALIVPGIGMAEWLGRGAAAFEIQRTAVALGSTVVVAALGAACVVAIAFPLAVLAVRWPGRLARAAELAAYAGHALPGVVVGLAVVFFGIRFARPVYQELPLLIMAYVILFLSLALGVTQAAVAQAPPALEDVARTLGHSPRRARLSITGRLAAPGLAMAGALVFLTVMKELPATLFLRPTGMETLATELWGRISAASYAAAAPYAIAVVLVAAVPTAVLALFGERRERA